MSEDLPTRLMRFLSPVETKAVIEVLEAMARETCVDRDCINRSKHGGLGPHRWRHRPVAPFDRGLFGWRCFDCGKYKWHVIHRTR